MFGQKFLLEYSDIEDFVLVLVGFWLIPFYTVNSPVLKAAVYCDANYIL